LPSAGRRRSSPTNRPGATGNIGARRRRRRQPDGYTLLLTATSFTTNPALKPAPFDPVKDFAPIALLATGALGVYVESRGARQDDARVRDPGEIAPWQLYYSSPGNGGPQHLAMELLKLENGIDVVHVPYKGAAGAISDLVGGHVQAMVSALQTVAPHVQSGRLRMLAVMSAKRSDAFPDVPTLKEAGLPEMEVETWYAILRAGRHARRHRDEGEPRDERAAQGGGREGRDREAGPRAGRRHARSAGRSHQARAGRLDPRGQGGGNQGGLTWTPSTTWWPHYRILAEHGVIDAYGHVSLRSPTNPQRYYLARSLAPERVQAEDIMEYDLDSIRWMRAVGNR